MPSIEALKQVKRDERAALKSVRRYKREQRKKERIAKMEDPLDHLHRERVAAGVGGFVFLARV